MSAAIAAAGNLARADTYKYVATSGNWNVPASWSDVTTGTTPVYPGFTNNTFTNDTANIDNGGSVTIDATQSIGTLGPPSFGPGPINIADLANSTAALNVTGGQLVTSSDIRIGGAGTFSLTAGKGTVTQSAGLVYLAAGNINDGYGGTGSYNLSGGTLEMQSNTPLLVVGNKATNGTAVFNQTGGTVYLQVIATATGVQLGRTTGAGTYSISAGKLLAGNLLFGSAAAAGYVNTFNLSGTGNVVTNNITVLNTTGTNVFNMTGGSLTANSVAITLTNSGGTLNPATATFATVGTTGADPNALPINAIGTTAFKAASYTQSPAGSLAIDLASASSFDQLTFDTGLATLGGTIAVDTLGGYDPAIGTTFDIVTSASTTVPVIDTALVTGTTPSGNAFVAAPAVNGTGNEVLRLTVIAAPTPEPASLGVLGLAAVGLMKRKPRKR